MGEQSKKAIMYNKHNHCLICSSNNLTILPNFQKDYLVQCISCKFVFCNRIPTNVELLIHYKKYKRGNLLSPITLMRYNELLDNFEQFRQTNNILDIGCGDGYFLDAAKNRGWNVYGTEFTDEAIEILDSKGIKSNQGKLETSNYHNEMFDVITSFEVLEHINNPNEECNSIYKILRKKGLIYVTTPNFNSFSRYFLKHWNIIEYPEHLSYYTPRTINKLFKINGFFKSKIETTGIHINRFRQSTGTIQSDGTYGTMEESLRSKTETKIIFKIFKKIANKILDILKKGDSLKAWYIKH